MMSAAVPVFLHMLGIPGSGKTTFLEVLREKWQGNPCPVLLGFDQVMQAMPEYQAMTDKVVAFDRFELPARELGYRKLDAMMVQRSPILFDNGGSAEHHIEILKKAAQQGYRIILVEIETDVTHSRARVDARAVTEGRHTPLAYLAERAEKLAKLKDHYRALTPHYYTIKNDSCDLAAFHAKCLEVIGLIQHDIAHEET